MAKDLFNLSLAILAVCITGLFTSCSTEKIYVDSNYITLESLASYHVGTPDPLQWAPPQGQEVTVHWKLYPEFYSYENVELVFKLLFKNFAKDEVRIAVTKPLANYTYSLLDEDYFAAGGILAYKAEFYGDGQLIGEWVHQLWTELIELTDPCEEEDNEELAEIKTFIY